MSMMCANQILLNDQAKRCVIDKTLVFLQVSQVWFLQVTSTTSGMTNASGMIEQIMENRLQDWQENLLQRRQTFSWKNQTQCEKHQTAVQD